MWYSAYVLGALFGVSELALSLFKRSKGDASSKDRSSLALIWTVIGVAMFFAFALSQQGPWLPASAILYPIGIALTLGGIALRWFAILWLGRWFTVNDMSACMPAAERSSTLPLISAITSASCAAARVSSR